ncbi:MAG TPA: multidrug effflux MFS transporter [Rhodanobacteraceae bacterium]|nr:multidrug effflux MFS transporter [Rhodanobacteraceae bacterium]
MSTSPHRNEAHGHAALAILLGALTMLGPFSIDTIFPGFPDIASGFGVSVDAVQQTVSVYLFTYAVMSLLHGPLSDALGRKPVIVAGMALYALASVGAALAGSLALLLVWRALQGLCVGAGIVIARAVVRDVYEGAQAQRLMSRMMMVFGIAPAVAPIVGAWLLGIDGWRGIFYALALFAAALSTIVLLTMREPHPRERRTPLRARSLYGTYRRIVADRPFWPLAVSATTNFSSLFLYIVSAPVFVLDLLRRSPQGFPWLFVPIIGGITFGSWVSGRAAGRWSAASTVGIAYVLMMFAALANLALAVLLPQPQVPWSVMPMFVQGLGVGLAFPTLTLLLLDRFPAQRGSASSMQTFISLLFNAVLAGVIAPVLYRSALTLAIGSAALVLVGYVSWRGYGAMLRSGLRNTGAEPS